MPQASADDTPNVLSALFSGSRTLLGGTRQQGLKLGTSYFLPQGWFLGWKMLGAMYCIAWCSVWSGQDIELRIFLGTWTFLLGSCYFLLSTISVLLCMAYIARETPKEPEPGQPKPPPPPKSTRSPVPCILRWLTHVCWVFTCLASLVCMFVYWIAIYDGITASSVEINTTVLSFVMLVDEWLIETDYKLSFFLLGEYFFIIYMFFNLAYYYETTGDDRLTWKVFDWEDAPGTAVLYILFILVILVPAASMLHYTVFSMRERMYTSYRRRVTPPPPAAEEPKAADPEAAPAQDPKAADPGPPPAAPPAEEPKKEEPKKEEPMTKKEEVLAAGTGVAAGAAAAAAGIAAALASSKSNKDPAKQHKQAYKYQQNQKNQMGGAGGMWEQPPGFRPYDSPGMPPSAQGAPYGGPPGPGAPYGGPPGPGPMGPYPHAPTGSYGGPGGPQTPAGPFGSVPGTPQMAFAPGPHQGVFNGNPVMGGFVGPPPLPQATFIGPPPPQMVPHPPQAAFVQSPQVGGMFVSPQPAFGLPPQAPFYGPGAVPPSPQGSFYGGPTPPTVFASPASGSFGPPPPGGAGYVSPRASGGFGSQRGGGGGFGTPPVAPKYASPNRSAGLDASLGPPPASAPKMPSKSGKSQGAPGLVDMLNDFL